MFFVGCGPLHKELAKTPGGSEEVAFMGDVAMWGSTMLRGNGGHYNDQGEFIIDYLNFDIITPFAESHYTIKGFKQD
ncbi:hypothetical protein ACFLZM_07035 [Thermodesulfobacteriota bacterium]